MQHKCLFLAIQWSSIFFSKKPTDRWMQVDQLGALNVKRVTLLVNLTVANIISFAFPQWRNEYLFVFRKYLWKIYGFLCLLTGVFSLSMCCDVSQAFNIQSDSCVASLFYFSVPLMKNWVGQGGGASCEIASCITSSFLFVTLLV